MLIVSHQLATTGSSSAERGGKQKAREETRAIRAESFLIREHREAPASDFFNRISVTIMMLVPRTRIPRTYTPTHTSHHMLTYTWILGRLLSRDPSAFKQGRADGQPSLSATVSSFSHHKVTPAAMVCLAEKARAAAIAFNPLLTVTSTSRASSAAVSSLCCLLSGVSGSRCGIAGSTREQ